MQASELIRSLLKSDRPPSLAQAIIEVDRINKTLYLLNYVDIYRALLRQAKTLVGLRPR
ncbi:Tn3 family transposase [Aeromonas veronii]